MNNPYQSIPAVILETNDETPNIRTFKLKPAQEIPFLAGQFVELTVPGFGEAPWDARSIDREIRADALRHLALERRRRHRYEEAAEAWRQLIETGAGPGFTQEARRALAIHHEHRVRNLEEARRHAEGALASEQDPAAVEALRHRIARLDRKLGRG